MQRGQNVGCEVFPACAGMSLHEGITANATTSFPRMRGDEPITLEEFARLYAFSPHARG